MLQMVLAPLVISQYDYGLEVEAHDALIGGKLNLSDGVNSVIIGPDAGINDDGNNKNILIGHSAGKSNSSGSSNVSIGDKAGAKNTTGDYNISIGDQAGLFNVTGSNNVNIGFQSGLYAKQSNNTFVGHQTGTQVVGEGNTFIGFRSGKDAATRMVPNTLGPVYNTFIGFEAGMKAKDYSNTLVGAKSAHSLESGGENTIIGAESAEDLVLGDTNTIIGYRSGNNIENGHGNTIVGTAAMFRGGTSCGGNTVLGYYANANNLNGHGNVVIGYTAGFDFVGNNSLLIENSGQFPNTLIYGNFDTDRVGINWDYNISPGSTFNVNGTSEFLDDVTINGTTTLDGQSVHDGQAHFNDIIKLKPAIYSPSVGSSCSEQGAILYGSDDQLYFCSSSGWKTIVIQ